MTVQFWLFGSCFAYSSNKTGIRDQLGQAPYIALTPVNHYGCRKSLCVSLHVYPGTLCVLGALGGQKRALTVRAVSAGNKWSPLQEQCMHLVTEPSLYPIRKSFLASNKPSHTGFQGDKLNKGSGWTEMFISHCCFQCWGSNTELLVLDQHPTLHSLLL